MINTLNYSLWTLLIYFLLSFFFFFPSLSLFVVVVIIFLFVLSFHLTYIPVSSYFTQLFIFYFYELDSLVIFLILREMALYKTSSESE